MAAKNKNRTPLIVGGAILLLGGGYLLTRKKKDESDGLPWGLKNKNPLNLIKTDYSWPNEVMPNDTPYEKFPTFKDGFFANLQNIRYLLKKYGPLTLPELITWWATGGKSVPTNYIDFVLNETAINPDQKFYYVQTDPGMLEKARWWQIVRAMAIFENGTKYTGTIDGLKNDFYAAWDELWT